MHGRSASAPTRSGSAEMALALIRKQSGRSPEREALAAAIADHASHLKGRDAAIRAEASADGAVYAARRAVNAAETGIEAAVAAAARHVHDQALGIAGDAPVTVRAARERLVDAEDALAAATGAHEALRADLARFDASLTGIRLKAAVTAVLQREGAVAARAVADHVARLECELVAAGQALEFLIGAKAYPVSDEIGHKFGKPADPAIRSAQMRLTSPPLSWRDLLGKQDGAHQWRAALAALETNAGALLPAAAAG